MPLPGIVGLLGGISCSSEFGEGQSPLYTPSPWRFSLILSQLKRCSLSVCEVETRAGRKWTLYALLTVTHFIWYLNPSHTNMNLVNSVRQHIQHRSEPCVYCT
ncbi:hypothetical protein K443DRAFT_520820 [Laccaria amethystina LaAM-08-1]|uniref:Uncharacterized protein n=1 Tax=Laccaria amethystina LaAM-08-1 TaxID=1095629 RepID=A0A0C9Y2T2_9AGAR|nr:hypothetical protein K443DRAFT_520820 [Laccaria amethystina LaAM-08-1]